MTGQTNLLRLKHDKTKALKPDFAALITTTTDAKNTYKTLCFSKIKIELASVDKTISMGLLISFE
jgi:hypothetical protein